ncbi:MAG: hypothetical protein ACJ8AW_04925 [Rhodopila sp.]
MDKSSHRNRLKTGLLITSMLAAPGVASANSTAIDGNNRTVPTPPGQYVTPLKIPGAVQQMLNPGLANYPDFVAGEAVKAVASPDGTTLAVLTAGHNGLYFNAGANIGTPDNANSSQYIFVFDI